MYRFFIGRILSIIMLLLTIHITATAQRRRGYISTSDSTKLPSQLKSIEFTGTTADSSAILKLGFLTKEQPDAIHMGYDLDSIQLFSNGDDHISLETIVKDTSCFDSVFTSYCNWYFKFRIDTRQRKFLHESEIDKMIFYKEGLSWFTVYPANNDKKIFQTSKYF